MKTRASFTVGILILIGMWSCGKISDSESFYRNQTRDTSIIGKWKMYKLKYDNAATYTDPNHIGNLDLSVFELYNNGDFSSYEFSGEQTMSGAKNKLWYTDWGTIYFLFEAERQTKAQDREDPFVYFLDFSKDTMVLDRNNQVWYYYYRVY